MINFSAHHCYSAGKLFPLLLAVFLFGFNGCVRDRNNQRITEPEVLELMDKVEAATKNQDAAAIVANMSEKVEIRVTFSYSGRTQTFTYNREQYQDITKKSFSIGDSRTYSRQKTLVKIAPDGKSAIVTDEVTESVRINGPVVRSVANEVATIGRENGKLVIQYLEATGTQTTTPGQ